MAFIINSSDLLESSCAGRVNSGVRFLSLVKLNGEAMSCNLQRNGYSLPRAFLFLGTFILTFSFGWMLSYVFNNSIDHTSSMYGAHAVLTPPIPKVMPDVPVSVSDVTTYQGLWHVYWPSDDGTLPELKPLPVIDLILNGDRNNLTGTAYLYHVRNDGYGEYVLEKSETKLTEIRGRKGILFFTIRRDDEDRTYKLWLVNHNEAKLSVVGEGPAIVFRVRRGRE